MYVYTSRYINDTHMSLAYVYMYMCTYIYTYMCIILLVYTSFYIHTYYSLLYIYSIRIYTHHIIMYNI